MVSPTLPVIIVPVNAFQNNTSGEPVAIKPAENSESELSTHGPSIVVGTGKQTGTDETVAVADDNAPGSAPVEPVSQITTTPSASDPPVNQDLSLPSLPSPHNEIIDESATSLTSEVPSGTDQEPMQVSQEIVIIAPVAMGHPVPSQDTMVPPDVLVVAGEPLASANGHVPSNEPLTTPLEVLEKKPAGVMVEVPKDSVATANPSSEPSHHVESVSAEQPEAKQLSQNGDSSVLDSTGTAVTLPPPHVLPIEPSIVPTAPPSSEPAKQLGEERPTTSTDGGTNTASVITEPRKEPVEESPKSNGHKAGSIQRFPSLRSKFSGSPSSSKSSTLATRKHKKSFIEKIKSIFSHDHHKEKK